jgi:hypothetical protein
MNRPSDSEYQLLNSGFVQFVIIRIIRLEWKNIAVGNDKGEYYN